MSQPRPHQFSAEGLPDGTYSVVIVAGIVTWGTALAPNYLTTTIGGVESLVWDGTGSPVYTEVP